MLKRVRVVLVLLLIVVGFGVYITTTSKSLFFSGARDLLIRATVIGVVLGSVRSVIKNKPRIIDGNITRHDAGSFLSHWGTATGIFLLIASGIIMGFFPPSSRVLIDMLFGVNLHYLGLVITLLCGFFWAADFILSRGYKELIPNARDIIYGTIGKYLLRRKWNYEGKYLSSQKSAFLAFAFIGFAIFVTGVIKVSAYVWPISTSIHTIVTYIHDLFSIFFILLLIMHVAIVIMLRHWLAFRSFFTGKIPEEYVKDEFPLWYDELVKDHKNDENKQ
ncbi:cytochrome b/b6 domain-containing protein [Chloroflexota bacterium]